ncbi:MAG: hypothetical protein KGH56_02400 [Patescibacteria group bacterium]|nr:hypothetical protein [Patescibacteria group bacterium]
MADRSDIERIVMRRVRLIRILGLIISTAVLAALTFIAALWGIGREVWVARVFENAPIDTAYLPSFFLAAFLHTRLIVQVLSVLTLASLIYLISEVARFVTGIVLPKAS